MVLRILYCACISGFRLHKRCTDKTDWRLRQDWQPLPLRMTRGGSEIASGRRYGKRHDGHSLRFQLGGMVELYVRKQC